MTTPPPNGTDRFEGILLVLILLGIGAVSAAASFTHIHDWTMANSPAGTGDWFGWAYAVVSDLVPLGVGLEARRRRRHTMKIGAYPITIILAAAALSLAGQLAQAKPSITGWLLAAVPALGFLALTKLVLSRPTPPVAARPEPARVPAPVPVHATLHPTTASTVDLVPDGPGPVAGPPAEDLLPGARIVADAYHRATGHRINREALAERLQIPLHTAQRLLDALAPTQPPRTTTVPARFNSPAVEALA